MPREITVIAANETFSVKGLLSKIAQQGFPVRYSGVSGPEIAQNAKDSDVIVYYTYNFDARARAGLSQLKDLIVGTGKELILIGTKEEYSLVTAVIPEENVRDFFERPFDMKSFLDRLSDYLLDAAMEESKKVILVVDDDVNYLNIVREWLKSSYLIARANTSMQAIQWLAKNHADLVLLDYEMPVTSGAKMIEMLRSEEATRDTPVMFLTAHSDRDHYLRVKDYHPAGFLLKTIDKGGLLKELRNFFDQEKKKQGGGDTGSTSSGGGTDFFSPVDDFNDDFGVTGLGGIPDTDDFDFSWDDF